MSSATSSSRSATIAPKHNAISDNPMKQMPQSSQNYKLATKRFSFVDVHIPLNYDKSAIFLDYKKKTIPKSHLKSYSESCLNNIKFHQKSTKWFDKMVEVVEQKIRLYLSRGIIRKSSKKIATSDHSTMSTNSENNAPRKKPKISLSKKNSFMDSSEGNNVYYDGHDRRTICFLPIPRKKAVQIKQSPWSFLRKNYPRCSAQFINALQNFTFLADQCYNHTTTDPTERFFIQQLSLVASNALLLTTNDDQTEMVSSICMESLDNFVNEIRQIYLAGCMLGTCLSDYLGSGANNLSYQCVEQLSDWGKLLIKILKIFENGIRIMESVEISSFAYWKAFDRMNFFDSTTTRQHIEAPLLFKCFNKVPSIYSLLVLLRQKQKQNLNRSNSSTISKPRLSSSVIRKTSVPPISTNFNSLYTENGLNFDSEIVTTNDDNDDLPAITHRIEDFTIIKLISQGASATVYLVNCNRTFEHYALKMIGKRSILIKNQVKNVFVERDVLSVTKSPFIVELYASFETSTHVCLLTEYVYGGDCAAILRKRKPLSFELIRHVTAQLILAIEYIHKMGIVHRDIKPANVLLSRDGAVKLTDFGLCTVTLPKYSNEMSKKCDIEKIDGECCLVGTPDYFAPEIIRKIPYAPGKSVDWWCLGLFVYEASFTEPPFYGETIEELFNEILYGKIPWPTDVFSIANETKDFIEHLLQKNPDERWGDYNIDTVKSHSLFENQVDWDNIHRKKFPALKLSSIRDTRHFDCRSEFYDHDTDFMSDLSLEEFSKVSESEVFQNYQYSSPSFSNKIRLSASLNPYSDESRDSSSIKNMLESSLDSEKSSMKTLPYKIKFNPNHRSSFLGTVYEHPPSLNYIPDIKSHSPTKTSSSIHSGFSNNASSPKPLTYDSHCKSVVVTLKRNECDGKWPGFIIGSKLASNENYSASYYIKELTTVESLHPSIHTNMFISHIDGISTHSMDFKELTSLIDNAGNHLVLTLVPNFNIQGYHYPQHFPSDIDTEVSLKSGCSSTASSGKDKFSTIDSQLSAIDLDATTSSFMNSTFNSEYEFYCHRSQRKNSNLEPDINHSICLMNTSNNYDIQSRFSTARNSEAYYKHYDSYSIHGSSLADQIRDSSHDLNALNDSDAISDDNTKNSTN